MSELKIDVCVVTRNGKLPVGLQNIPVNKLMVETIKPVGIARQICISKVTTRIFAFIDDDIIINDKWFELLYYYIMKEDVGAVWGTTTGKGFGWMSKYSYTPIGLKELKYGERFNTNNCLIKTELVKDWIPIYGLNCYEDLDLGNHIMKKNYKILFVPSTAIHDKGWKGLRRSALWAGYRWVEAYPNNSKMWEYVRRILSPFKILLLNGVPSSIYIIYRNFWFIIGMIKRDMGMKE